MLIERLAQLAAQGGGRFVVLVIDEAQGMTQREWMWLVELHSLLEKQRIRLCVFAIGSETQNSLQTPASHSSIVAFKPTVGRVSRHGVLEALDAVPAVGGGEDLDIEALGHAQQGVGGRDEPALDPTTGGLDRHVGSDCGALGGVLRECVAK